MQSQLYRPLLFMSLFNIIFFQCEGCSEPIGWTPQTLADRANQALQIIYGHVAGVHGATIPGAQQYIVEFDVDCVLKGIPIEKTINMTEVKIDCVDSNMQYGESYIVFINVLRDGYGRNRYATHDINIQAAAQKASTENFQIMNKTAGINTSQCNYEASPTVAGRHAGAGRAGEMPSTGVPLSCVNGTDVDSEDCTGAGNTLSKINSYLWLFMALYLVCTHML